jgi:hypothetical protein
MNLRGYAVCIIAAASAATVPVAAFAACDARSGPNTAALVELYTSEGCSSCPPADRQLSGLRQSLDPAAQAVPLALHVGYWDDIGWRDPYAQAAFAQRQNWLARANRERTIYTPEFFVSGRELSPWWGSLQKQVRQLNAEPAAAWVHLRAHIAANGALALDVEAKAHPGADPTALYFALTENGLTSKVTRGENSGATLMHDHVVRAWIGPVPLVAGAVRVQREIALPADWNRARLELVAFVQDTHTGAVLQALGALRCADP